VAGYAVGTYRTFLTSNFKSFHETQSPGSQRHRVFGRCVAREAKVMLIRVVTARQSLQGPCDGSGGQSTAVHREGLGSIPGHSV